MELSKSGYPELLDWQDYIRPETMIIFDGDQLAFTAASAAEKRTIQAIHKASGRAKEFKTRTEFWGRKKIAIEGWLGDQNLVS